MARARSVHCLAFGTSKHLSGGDLKDAKACISCFFPLTNGSTEIRLCNSLTINGMSYCPGINNLLHVGHGGFENEAPKTRKWSTQNSKMEHPKLVNGAPKSRKWSTQKSKTKHLKLKSCVSFKNTRQSFVKSPAAGIQHDNKHNAVQNYSSRTTRCCKCISLALTIGHFGGGWGTGASIRFKLSINWQTM